MALRFRELPWYFQLVLFVLVAVGVYALGAMIDFPPIFPIQAARTEQAELQRKYKQLVDEVAKLQAVKQRHQELKTRLAATKDQLAQIQTVVPEEKKTDDFMRTLQASATNAQVSLRRLTSRPVVTKEFYAEMPFEVELDGPYYAAMEFFDRLGRSTRIINAGGLRLQGIEAQRGGGKFDYAPGTSVAGVCVVTTYYIPAPAEVAAVAPAAGAAAAPRRGAAGGPGPAPRP